MLVEDFADTTVLVVESVTRLQGLVEEFADNTVLVVESAKELQYLATEIRREYERKKLKMNMENKILVTENVGVVPFVGSLDER